MNIRLLFVSIGMLSTIAFSQELRFEFVSGKGIRYDYFLSNDRFNLQEDNLLYKFIFIIPTTGNKAKIQLFYLRSSSTEPDDYSAIILHRSDDMITMMLQYSPEYNLDKIELYTIFPKLGIGFTSKLSSYLGLPKMKYASKFVPQIPQASASVIPIRQLKKK